MLHMLCIGLFMMMKESEFEESLESTNLGLSSSPHHFHLLKPPF